MHILKVVVVDYIDKVYLKAKVYILIKHMHTVSNRYTCNIKKYTKGKITIF